MARLIVSISPGALEVVGEGNATYITDDAAKLLGLSAGSETTFTVEGQRYKLGAYLFKSNVFRVHEVYSLAIGRNDAL